MLARILIVTFVLAAVSAKPDLRLLGIRSDVCLVDKCGDGSAVSSDKNTVEWNYGVKDQPRIGASFQTTYNNDGSVSFEVSPRWGASSWPAGTKTRLTIGNTNDPACRVEFTGFTGASLSFPNVLFSQCGFTQTFGRTLVERSIVIQLRQRFPVAGTPVFFIGDRDINVHFNLSPKNPTTPEEIIPFCPWRNASLGTCAPLTHSVVALKAVKFSETWKFKVVAENYIPENIKVGFTLENCFLQPYIKDTNGVSVLSTDPAHFLHIIRNGEVHKDFVPKELAYQINHVTPGKDYELSILRLTSRNIPEVLKLDPAQAPRLSCTVCLCDFDQCPQAGTIPVAEQWIGRSMDSMHNFELLPPLEGRQQKLKVGPINIVPARRKQML